LRLLAHHTVSIGKVETGSIGRRWKYPGIYVRCLHAQVASRHNRIAVSRPESANHNNHVMCRSQAYGNCQVNTREKTNTWHLRRRRGDRGWRQSPGDLRGTRSGGRCSTQNLVSSKRESSSSMGNKEGGEMLTVICHSPNNSQSREEIPLSRGDCGFCLQVRERRGYGMKTIFLQKSIQNFKKSCQNSFRL
jgi:hypothetical protein